MEEKGYFYYYDSEDKYYIGKKSIADNANYDLSGRLLIPGHATLIKPPINIEEGYVPIFNEDAQKWEVKKDDFWHCTVNVYPHHFGEFPVEWLPQLYAFNTLGVMNIDNSIRLNNLFKDIPNIANGLLIMERFISRINIINKRILELYQRHDDWLKSNDIHTIDSMVEYKLIGEDIIHQLKKLLDEFIVAIYLHDYYKDIKKKHEMVLDDYGKDFFSSKDDSEIITQIKVRINFDKYKTLLETVKELDNGFKHNLTPAISDSQIGLIAPTIILYRYKRRSLKTLTKYNVYIGGLIDQCNKFMYEYLKTNIAIVNC